MPPGCWSTGSTVSMAENVRAVRAAADRQSGMLRDVPGLRAQHRCGDLSGLTDDAMDLRVLCERLLDAVQERHPDRAIALVSKPARRGRVGSGSPR